MKRIRGRVIALVGCLVAFFGMTELLEPIEVSGLAYIFVIGTVLVTLFATRSPLVPFRAVLIVPLLVFLGLKALTGGLASSIATLVSLLELGGIALTSLLSHLLALSISEFEHTVSHITIGQPERMPESPTSGEACIYREVRRARNHQRPLALMAVAVDERTIETALDRMVLEAQQAMMKQYALSSVSKTLCSRLEDCDIIVQLKDHFLIVLPETTPEALPNLIERLRLQVMAEVGVELRIGTASLPDDGYTLEGLLEKARQYMDETQGFEVMPEVRKISVA